MIEERFGQAMGCQTPRCHCFLIHLVRIPVYPNDETSGFTLDLPIVVCISGNNLKHKKVL